MVKTAEDDDPIAIMTVFNTLLHKDKPYMQQTADYLCSKCSDAAVKAELRQASRHTRLAACCLPCMRISHSAYRLHTR